MAKSPDFRSLWDKLVASAAASGDSRMTAALLNHEGRKEVICRKLGVVGDADVARVAKSMRPRDL